MGSIVIWTIWEEDHVTSFNPPKKKGYNNVQESIEETNDSVSQAISENTTKPPPIITDM